MPRTADPAITELLQLLKDDGLISGFVPPHKNSGLAGRAPDGSPVLTEWVVMPAVPGPAFLFQDDDAVRGWAELALLADLPTRHVIANQPPPFTAPELQNERHFPGPVT